MKTFTKVTVTALAAILTSTAFAADLQIVRVDHGRAVTYVLRPVEQPESTLALYSNGRGITQPTYYEASPSELRVKEHEMGRGTRHFYQARE